MASLVSSTNKVRFIGSHQIDWEPPRLAPIPAPQPSQSSEVDESTIEPREQISDGEDLKKQFARYIRDQIRKRSPHPDGSYEQQKITKVKAATEKKDYYRLLGVVLDPTSTPSLITTAGPTARRVQDPHLTIEDFFANQCDNLLGTANKIFHLWTDAVVTPQPARPAQSNKSEKARTKEDDKYHAYDVKGWYGDECVLSGPSDVLEGAQILDVQAMENMNNDTSQIWQYLRVFWPREKRNEMDICSRVKENIIPLKVDIHRLWDRHRFALRPTAHKKTPNICIYIQLSWLCGIENQGGLLARGDEEVNLIVDQRRPCPGNAGCFSQLSHGDVYEIEAKNPAEYPIPSLEFLQIRFAVQKLFAGARAAGSLTDIFLDEPDDEEDEPEPEPEGLNLNDATLSGDWEDILEEAIHYKVLDIAKAQKWRKALLVHEYWERRRDEEDWDVLGE